MQYHAPETRKGCKHAALSAVCSHIQSSTLPAAGAKAQGFSSPTVLFACGISHPIKASLVELAALASHLRCFEANEAIDPHFRGTVLGVPRTGADVHPAIAVFIGVIALASIARGEHKRDNDAIALLSKHEYGAVFALRGIFFERYPRPHDLARIGVAVCRRCIRDGQGSAAGAIGECGVRFAWAGTVAGLWSDVCRASVGPFSLVFEGPHPLPGKATRGPLDLTVSGE